MKLWTKICGVTRVEDAVVAARAGADAIGLNFCAASSRYCDPDAAAAIVRGVDGGIAAYGVFAGATPAEIAAVVERVGLVGVQLHGGEDAAFVDHVRALLPQVEIVRAVAVTARVVVTQALSAARGHRVLLDSARGGGSGACFDAALVAGLDLTGAIVAGGLGPHNVAEVIARLQPYGVDAASGVERAPGLKDHAKVREFIENAKRSAA